MFSLSYQLRERLRLLSPRGLFSGPKFGLFDIAHFAFNSKRLHFSREQQARDDYPNCAFDACRVGASDCHEYRSYRKKGHCYAWTLNCPSWPVLEPYEGNENENGLWVETPTGIVRHGPGCNRNGLLCHPSRGASHRDGQFTDLLIESL